MNIPNISDIIVLINLKLNILLITDIILNFKVSCILYS